MKKHFFAVFLAALCLFALTSCSLKPGGVSLPWETSGSDTSAPEGGGTQGYLGNTMSTYWFDFVVNDAYLRSEYGGYTPPAAIPRRRVIRCWW